MSDTPRTDAAAMGVDNEPSNYVPADFARELERQNSLLRNETLICADCDAVRKADYDSVMASLKAVRELCTADHESKERFIARVLLCLPNVQAQR